MIQRTKPLLLLFLFGLTAMMASPARSVTPSKHSAKSWYKRSLKRYRQRKYRQALSAIKKAIRSLPHRRNLACTRSTYLLQQAKIYKKMSRRSQALHSARKALRTGCKIPPLLRKIRRFKYPRKKKKPRKRAAQEPTPVSATQNRPSPSFRPRVKRRLIRIKRKRIIRLRRRRFKRRRFKRTKTHRELRDSALRGRVHGGLGDGGGGVRNGGGVALGMLRTGGRGRKADKKEKKKVVRRLRVWQRTKQNTILSKVSVGGGKYLKLQKLRINVQVEGMRVRTVIDHIYSNPYNRTLQGTFKYTLPADASVSYYAMFVGNQQRRRRTPNFFSGKGPSSRQLIRMQPNKIARVSPHKNWGKLREARLVPAEKGRQVYEAITRRRIDPALLEQDAPNTFTGKVFPIPAKGYNRIIIAYEQTLPQYRKHHVYRFRFPPDVAKMIDFSIGFNPKLASLTKSNLRALRCKRKGKAPFVRCYWEQNKPKKDAVFYFQSKRQDIAWIGGSDPLNGQKYLLSQVRVSLPRQTSKKSRSQAIFLLDTSLSANPDLFAAHVSLLRRILKQNKSIKRFNVLFFDVAAKWAKADGWLKNNHSTRRKLFRKINRIVLEGATNFGAAMRALAHPKWYKTKRASSTDIFVLSDGQLNWGNRHIDPILFKYDRSQPWGKARFFAYQLGIGSENVGLLRRLVRRGGALFPCLGKGELRRCAKAHTKASVWLERVEIEGVGASQIMVAGRQTSVYSGGLITIAAQFQKSGTATIKLIGQFMGKPFRQTYSFPLKARGDLGPRAWGEMTTAQMIELEDPKLTKLIVAYSQHFHIPNKHCSFLILETNKEYKQYGLEKLKKSKKVKDAAAFLATEWKNKGRPVSMRERWLRLAKKTAKRYKYINSNAGRAIFSLLRSVPKKQYLFPDTGITKLWQKHMVPGSYLKRRKKKSLGFSPFVKEAKRRLAKESRGAIRALSCIVERYPSNPQSLRLVAYYLRAWNRPALAAQLFWQVLERRSFEPHAYRDVALSLVRMRRYGLASALYEMMVAGSWHRRFVKFKLLAREEYALLIYEALRDKQLPDSIKSALRRRKMMLGLSVRTSKIRVTVTWNTDNTDIDLFAVGPTGKKCYYSRKRTSDGGRLLQDITRGYGPERYENRNPTPGTYKFSIHYYGHRTNTFGNETHASVLIVHNAGTSQQSIQFKSFVLRKRKQKISIGTYKL